MFKSVTQRSTGEEIRDQIWSQIIEGTLKPGSKLPSEKKLIQQLKVSRSALRETLHKMVGEGILEIRHGQGTFVREPSTGSAIQGEVVSLLILSDTIKEIQEARLAIEPVLAAWAAERATDDQLKEIEDFITECVEAESVTFDDGWEFHRRLAHAAGNSAMAKIAGILYEMIQSYQQCFYDVHFDPRQDLSDHVEILEAIKKRDPELVRDLLHTHIYVADEILDGMINSQKQILKDG